MLMRVYAISLALMVLSAVLMPAPSALALSDEEMCKRVDALLAARPDHPLRRIVFRDPCRTDYWMLLKPKPLDEIMPSEERMVYRRTALDGDCQAATKLLAKRFVEGHPDVPSILANATDYGAWQRYVAEHDYDDIAFCVTLKDVNSAQAEIDRLALEAKPYAGAVTTPARRDENGEPGPRYRREFAVHLIYLLNYNLANPEVAKALLRLSAEGKAIRLHPEYEYFLALWLRSVGDRDPMVQAILDRPLDPKRKAAAAKVLETGELGDIKEFAE